jgi:hypothetical protein
VRVSLRTGRAAKVIDLPGGYSTSMAGSSSGSFLIVSVADSGGRGSLQRRDPVTGKKLAAIPLPDPARDDVTGIWGQDVYYAATAGQGVNTHLKRVAVPAACRVG